MTVADFMETALYQPEELGYYSRVRQGSPNLRLQGDGVGTVDVS